MQAVGASSSPRPGQRQDASARWARGMEVSWFTPESLTATIGRTAVEVRRPGPERARAEAFYRLDRETLVTGHHGNKR